MRQLQDFVHVDALPERVWSWLTRLTEHYVEWHPDHVSAEWVQGEPTQVGSILHAVEYLGGHREELRFEMTHIDPPHRMEYRVQGSHSILLPGGAFTISPDSGGSTFTAAIRCRFGAATARVFRRRVAMLRAHMRQEGENLKPAYSTTSFPSVTGCSAVIIGCTDRRRPRAR
jgi:hypothetical protein